MALLGTMNAGIIKIAPNVKGVAPSLWLGAAGLSLCGVFLTTYYSVGVFLSLCSYFSSSANELVCPVV